MTNAMMILLERVELMKAGKIGNTGKSFDIEINGEIRTIQEPEEIHTYAIWKNLGYQVKKGEKAITKLQIWKHTTKQKGEDEPPEERMIRKTAYFFSPAQVEKITA